MTVEAVVAIGAGVTAGSLVLLAFGLDSVIELASPAFSCGGCRLSCATDKYFRSVPSARRAVSAAFCCSSWRHT
jgi:hypothetical protein